jgi:transcription elongation factor Elf1
MPAETKVDFEVPREKWDMLSPEQKKMLKGLGVRPKTQKVAKAAKTPAIPLKEYNLAINFRCRLCGATQRKVFRMEDKDGVLLRGKELSDSSAKAERTQDVTVPHCKNCGIVLQTWGQRDLINKLLAMAKAHK